MSEDMDERRDDPSRQSTSRGKRSASESVGGDDKRARAAEQSTADTVHTNVGVTKGILKESETVVTAAQHSSKKKEIELREKGRKLEQQEEKETRLKEAKAELKEAKAELKLKEAELKLKEEKLEKLFVLKRGGHAVETAEIDAAKAACDSARADKEFAQEGVTRAANAALFVALPAEKLASPIEDLQKKSPSELLQFIEERLDLQSATHALQPHERGVFIGRDGRMVPRPDVYEDRKQVLERAVEYVVIPVVKNFTQAGPACVVASPGLGKSSLLDELCRQDVEGVLWLVISYNNFTNDTRGSMELNLVWRLLASFYFSYPATKYDADSQQSICSVVAADLIAGFAELRDLLRALITAFECGFAAHHRHLHTALLVDETEGGGCDNGDEHSVYNVLKSLPQMPSANAAGRAVVFTGLTPRVFGRDFVAVSVKPMRCITLTPCEHLLTAYAKHYEAKNAGANFGPGHAMYALLGLAAANPRVFWSLEHAWKHEGTPRHSDIAAVIRLVVKELDGAAKHYVKFDNRWLFASLSGLSVDVTDSQVVEGVLDGTLLTTAPAHERMGQPYMPLVKFLTADANSALSERLAFVVAKCALQRYNGKAYEEFSVAHLALLIESHAGLSKLVGRFSASDGDQKPSSYGSALKRASAQPLSLFDTDRNTTGTALLHPVQVCVKSSSVPTIKRNAAQLLTFQNDLWKDDWQLAERDPLMQQEEPFELAVGVVVFTTFPTNAGFDYCALFEATDGEPHLLLVECKSGNDRATVQPTKLVEKMTKLKKKLKAMFDAGTHPFVNAGIKSAKQVTVLFNVAREPQANKVNVVTQLKIESRKTPAFEGNVLLMDKHDVRRFLGPTFAPLHWLEQTQMNE